MTKVIRRVLIANRGEIAVRIIRAARDAGKTSIAVYADSDADNLFVKLADEAYALNGTTPAQTYLDVDKILTVAKQAGVDAIHPGYGFLSENAEFAEAVVAAGLVFAAGVLYFLVHGRFVRRRAHQRPSAAPS